MRTWWRLAAPLVVALITAFHGCGSDDAPRAPPRTAVATTTPSPASLLPSSPVESWTRRVSVHEWEPTGDAFAIGTWTIKTELDGTVSIYLPGTSTVDVSTEFSARGATLTVDVTRICDKPARYRWSATRRRLRLRALSDTCAEREILFEGVWRRRG